MNCVALVGRLTANPMVRVSTGGTTVATYTLAINRISRNENQQADFIRCIAFGKCAEFVEKYLKKGMKIGVSGRIQTGEYTDKDGVKHFTTDIVVESHEFCDSKR